MQNNFNSHPSLEIYLLGKFQAKIDGVLIHEKLWLRRSAKSLVKLLALKPFHTLHREQIMDLLFTEQSPENALNNLNKAIYGARRALEPDLVKGSHSRFILTKKNQIILESPGLLVVDLNEFEKLAGYALQNSDWETGEKAIKLYRGDLLIEDVYEDWIYARRESMRILFRKTATKTAKIHIDRGDQTKGIEILKKLIAEDSADEYVHRLLMRAYAETGSKYQARKQFEHCRAALHALGIEPEPETIKLEQSIKRGEILPVQSGNGHQLLKSAAPNIVSTPRITPLTFQNGVIKSAKFLPEGKAIIVSAVWEGGVRQLYETSPDAEELRSLGIEDADVFSVSNAGDIAVALQPSNWNAYVNPATLAIISSGETSPRSITENIHWAVWHPSKTAETTQPAENFLAGVRDRDGKNCLEFPIGNVIFETGGWIGHPQFSHDGKKIAFLQHPIPDDDEGYVVVLDLEKNNEKRNLTGNWLTIGGVAWMNDEVCFTASQEAKSRTLYAVNLKGEERLVYRGMGRIRLRDISKSGSLLISDEKMRNYAFASRKNTCVEHNLSWHDFSGPRDISDDGELVLIEDGGMSVGSSYLSFIRKFDGSATKMLGSGAPIQLSPDKKFALVRIPSPDNHLALIDVATKEVFPLETDAERSLIYQEFACFSPDGKRILFAANKLNCGTQIYIQDIDCGKPICFTPHAEGIRMDCGKPVSPNGKFVVLKNPDSELALYRIADGTFSPLKNLDKDFSVIRWTADGKYLFVRREPELPAVVYRYNLSAGTLENWLEIMPKDTAGVKQIVKLNLTPDGEMFVYSFKRVSSDLFLIEDLQ